jgi:hypothetical protein
LRPCYELKAVRFIDFPAVEIHPKPNQHRRFNQAIGWALVNPRPDLAGSCGHCR